MRKLAFSLVELMIVLLIITLLAGGTVYVITKWISKSKDGKRLANYESIRSYLDMEYYEKGYYPMPSESPVLLYSENTGNVLGYQGYFGETNVRESDINGNVKDMLDDEYYTYTVNAKRNKYQIGMMLENKAKFRLPDTRYFTVFGDEIGTFLDSNFSLIQRGYASGFTGLDIKNTEDKYYAYLDRNRRLQGTGSTLGILEINFGYREPISCDEINQAGLFKGDGEYLLSGDVSQICKESDF